MTTTVSSLVTSAERGDQGGAEALFAALYSELHRLAKRELARRGAGVSLGVTTLLHEAYLDMSARDVGSFPDRGDHEEAVRLARGAIKACELNFGTDKPSAHTGRARLTLGFALLRSGRTAEARVELRAATLVALAAGADHPWTREAREKLAQPPGM